MADCECVHFFTDWRQETHRTGEMVVRESDNRVLLQTVTETVRYCTLCDMRQVSWREEHNLADRFGFIETDLVLTLRGGQDAD